MQFVQMIQVAAVGFLAAMSPGPGGLLILRTSTRFGRVAGLVSTAGIALGDIVLAGIAVATIGLMNQLGDAATSGLQFLSAAYLAYLGIKLVKAKPTTELRNSSASKERLGDFFLQGLLTTVLNPKALIFYVAVVPQLPGAAEARVEAGGLFVVGALVWFLILSQLSGALSRFMRPAVHVAIDRVSGGVLLGLALAGVGAGVASIHVV